MFIQIHAIHSVPPSCINRDDVGAVKNATYGGVRRHRVSSQAWKRAMRTYAADAGLAETATRTLHLPDMIADRVTNNYDRDEAVEVANKVVNVAGYKTKKAKGDEGNRYVTESLTFISPGEVEVLADITGHVLEGNDMPGKKDIKTKLSEVGVTPDVALFGRMVASDKGLNIDACAQVAHALSTHEAHAEVDFYTAVDDLTTDSEGGSGFLGTQEMVSSTLLRYASVDVDRLRATLGKDAAEVALSAFVEAFAKSMPTGKANSFANTTLPDYVLVEVVDAPVNYIGAFESPVRSRGNLIGSSIESLEDYRERLSTVYGLAGDSVVMNTCDKDSSTLSELCAWAAKQV